MENKNLEKQQNDQSLEQEGGKDQPGWFQDFVDHYDVDKPKQGEILKGTILDIQESSVLLDVGFKRDAIVPSQDLEKVDQSIREDLKIGDQVYVSVIKTPMGDDDLLVSLSRGLSYKTWVKAEELSKTNELIELEVIDQNRGGLLVSFENIRGFIPNSHIPSIRRGTSTQKAGEIKGELIGKKLPVKIIEVNQKERRLVFSARVAQKDQRQKRLKEIEVGKVIKSRVVNVVDFGVFVDLAGVDGLVHKSEIDWDRVKNPSKLYKVGDEIEVKVVGVDVEKERVSLSRKALLPNPWVEIAEKYNIGDLVEGKVVSVLDFGAFVELPEGLHGLVHVSEVGYANTEDPKSVVKRGDQVLVRVIGIDPGRERVSLSMRRVPVSEQMEWMMNLEDAYEGFLVDGGVEQDLSETLESETPEGGSLEEDPQPQAVPEDTSEVEEQEKAQEEEGSEEVPEEKEQEEVVEVEEQEEALEEEGLEEVPEEEEQEEASDEEEQKKATEDESSEDVTEDEEPEEDPEVEETGEVSGDES
jgi:small subunit ribosomal protein S1